MGVEDHVGYIHTKLEKQHLEIVGCEILALLHAEKGLSLGEGFLSPCLGDAQDRKPSCDSCNCCSSLWWQLELVFSLEELTRTQDNPLY